MNSLVFKHFIGSFNRGDMVWSHPSQRQLVLLDGVSGALPEHAVKLCREWLQEQPENRLFRPEVIIDELNALLAKHKCQAAFCLATVKKTNEVIVDIIGNIRVYELKRYQPAESLRDKDMIHPTEVLGQALTPIPSRLCLPLSYDTKYLICSDGLSHTKIIDNGLRLDDIERNVKSKLDALKEENDWSAIVFPVDSTNEFSDSRHVDEVIIGDPSTDAAERQVHQQLAQQIMANPVLKGAKLVRNPFFKGKNSSREVDALLISPIGIFFIEVKGHEGDVELYVDSSERKSMVLWDRTTKPATKVRDANPVRKGIEAIRTFQHDLANSAGELIPEARKTVVICFTSSHGQATCIDGAGKRYPLPYSYGEAVVTDAHNLVSAIISRAKSWVGKRLKPLLSDEQIQKIADRFTHQREETENNPGYLLPGLTVDLTQEISGESSDYFKIYEASHYDDEVWAKRYIDDAFKRLDQGASAERVAREIPVLQRLGRHRVEGIPYYYWHYQNGNDLIIFLEPGYPTTLIDWLKKSPTREACIAILQQLLATLTQISEFSAPPIVLRSVNPRNIRLSSNNSVQLINFELVQSDDLKTLPINARTQFDRLYQSAEVLDASASVSGKADVYSVAMVIAYVLSGDVPKKVRLQQGRGFANLLEQTGLPEQDSDLLKKALHENPQQRPSMHVLNERIRQWK
ncbi:NERD domain-containing protein kinase family protein [Idiomarina aminovorans]|uniref:NERD domain-containing protein kinase family protein n=1 Tax=Idiomarina aminovorans TaxID=2914829 RepID=UPI0020047D6B|nr:NERD domain-containing protein kinase family protein [Idiomarina sp. ATCH4]MCK7460410.1 NERD domain-containing serine/threonine-protein kinase [Idiomarina sp. ATCH4]